MNRLLTFVVVLLMMSLTNCKDDRCNLEPDAGPCYALITKYYYDKKAKQCKSFTYGGCDGVVPFDTLEDCKNCMQL